MTIDEFRKWETEFLSFADGLAPMAQEYLRQAREALEDPSRRLPDSSPEEMAELCTAKIAGRIEDLMALYDRIQQTIGRPRRYWPFFDAIQLSDQDAIALREFMRSRSTLPTS